MIGWTSEERQAGLRHVIGMSRFLIRADVRCRNLASKALGLCRRRLSADSLARHGPACQARTNGQFPNTMPGPRQSGTGSQTFIINRLVARMHSLRRAVELVQAISGLSRSEANCLNYMRHLHDALQAWQDAAIGHLLTCSALHAEETGMPVERKTRWLHIAPNGSLAQKFLHPRGGKEAIDAIDIIPGHTGTLVREYWAS